MTSSSSRASLSNLCHPNSTLDPSSSSVNTSPRGSPLPSLFDLDFDLFYSEATQVDVGDALDGSAPVAETEIANVTFEAPSLIITQDADDEDDEDEERDSWVMPHAKRIRLSLSDEDAAAETLAELPSAFALPSLDPPAPTPQLPILLLGPAPDPSSESSAPLSLDIAPSPSKGVNKLKPGRPKAVPPPTSPPKYKKGRKGGRVGRLTQMLDGLPLELLTEILSHSTPATLLRLSRVARVFRLFLLSKSSRSVWIHAFANDGMPSPFACTKFFNEPTYAALIWDKECALCGREKIHKVVYRLRKRICEVCMKASLHHKLVLQLRHPGLHEMVWSCVPSTSRPQWYNLSSLPAHPVGTPPPTADANDWYMEGDVLRIGAELWAMEAEDMKNPKTSSDEGEGESRVVTFVKEFKDRQVSVEFDSKMLTEWQANLDKGRSKEKKDYRAERIAAVRSRLLQAGIAEEDVAAASQPTSAVYVHMDQPYPLTDRVWRKIHPLLLAHIDEIKLEREKQKVIAQNQMALSLSAATSAAAAVASSSNAPPPNTMIGAAMAWRPAAPSMSPGHGMHQMSQPPSSQSIPTYQSQSYFHPPHYALPQGSSQPQQIQPNPHPPQRQVPQHQPSHLRYQQMMNLGPLAPLAPQPPRQQFQHQDNNNNNNNNNNMGRHPPFF